MTWSSIKMTTCICNWELLLLVFTISTAYIQSYFSIARQTANMATKMEKNNSLHRLTVGAKKTFRCAKTQRTLYVWPAQHKRKKYDLETHGQRNACVLQDAYYAAFSWNCYVQKHHWNCYVHLERHRCARILSERPTMNTRCLVSWIEFCLVFHDDVLEDSDEFHCTKK